MRIAEDRRQFVKIPRLTFQISQSAIVEQHSVHCTIILLYNNFHLTPPSKICLSVRFFLLQFIAIIRKTQLKPNIHSILIFVQNILGVGNMFL